MIDHRPDRGYGPEWSYRFVVLTGPSPVWFWSFSGYETRLTNTNFLAVFALLEQLDPEGYNCYWEASEAVILKKTLDITSTILDPLGGMTQKLNIEFIQTLSKFLKDQDRAGSLWVDMQTWQGTYWSCCMISEFITLRLSYILM